MSDPTPIAQTGRPAEQLVGAAPVGPPAPVPRRLRRPGLLVGLAGVAAVVGVAALAPLLAPHDPLAQDLPNSLAPPFWSEGGSLDHPLGTDALGRDIASRLLFGARNSLLIGAGAVLLGSVLGAAAGLVAGFVGRGVDAVVMALGNVQLAFPFILLAIAILGVNPNRTHLLLVLVLGIPAWIVYARVVRSRVLAEKEKEYVLAARALGASGPRILLRYVLPSVWQVIPVIAVLDLGFIVLLESTLSFLGFGLQPPTPSWGSILAEGRKYAIVSPWLPVLPGLAIMLTVLSINLVADGLAAVFDPRLRLGAMAGGAVRGRGLRGRIRRAVRGRRETPGDAPGADGPLLRVRDLVVDFHLPGAVVHAVRGVSFDVGREQTLGIVGESGSGKTVTALSVIGLLPPSAVVGGTIRLDGVDLAGADRRTMAGIRGRRIGMIFQNPSSSLNPVLTVGYQMAEAIQHHRKVSRPQARAIARDALLAVGIGNADHVLGQYPFQLSGGMNQRVMIAMTMAVEPELLLADEPTTALDVTTQAQILDELRRIKAATRASIVLITHDIALVAEFADAVLVMYAGQVCETGPVRSVLDAPRHPYTRALLESVPRVEVGAEARLRTIPGELPDPTAPGRGCPFAPRCPAVMDVCRDVNPPPVEVAAGHRVACHLWPEGAIREPEAVAT